MAMQAPISISRLVDQCILGTGSPSNINDPDDVPGISRSDANLIARHLDAWSGGHPASRIAATDMEAMQRALECPHMGSGAKSLIDRAWQEARQAVVDDLEVDARGARRILTPYAFSFGPPGVDANVSSAMVRNLPGVLAFCDRELIARRNDPPALMEIYCLRATARLFAANGAAHGLPELNPPLSVAAQMREDANRDIQHAATIWKTLDPELVNFEEADKLDDKIFGNAIARYFTLFNYFTPNWDRMERNTRLAKSAIAALRMNVVITQREIDLALSFLDAREDDAINVRVENLRQARGVVHDSIRFEESVLLPLGREHDLGPWVRELHGQAAALAADFGARSPESLSENEKRALEARFNQLIARVDQAVEHGDAEQQAVAVQFGLRLALAYRLGNPIFRTHQGAWHQLHEYFVGVGEAELTQRLDDMAVRYTTRFSELKEDPTTRELIEKAEMHCM